MTPTATTVLYLVFTLGAAAVYFMLPHGDRRHRGVAIVFGVSALAAMIVFLAVHVVTTTESTAYFFLFAAIAIASAARVITHPRPVYNAIYFVLVVVSVAALMVLMGAEFVAIALIIIYAGAILVTYLFVIMLAQQQGSSVYDRRSREPFLAVLAGFVLMAAIASRSSDLPPSAAQRAQSVTLAQDEPESAIADEGNTFAIGAVLMTDYVVALEVAAVLLLISMVGAITLSQKRVPPDPFRTPARPLGEIGKEVGPF